MHTSRPGPSKAEGESRSREASSARKYTTRRARWYRTDNKSVGIPRPVTGERDGSYRHDAAVLLESRAIVENIPLGALPVSASQHVMPPPYFGGEEMLPFASMTGMCNGTPAMVSPPFLGQRRSEHRTRLSFGRAGRRIDAETAPLRSCSDAAVGSCCRRCSCAADRCSAAPGPPASPCRRTPRWNFRSTCTTCLLRSRSVAT